VWEKYEGSCQLFRAYAEPYFTKGLLAGALTSRADAAAVAAGGNVTLVPPAPPMHVPPAPPSLGVGSRAPPPAPPPDEEAAAKALLRYGSLGLFSLIMFSFALCAYCFYSPQILAAIYRWSGGKLGKPLKSLWARQGAVPADGVPSLSERSGKKRLLGLKGRAAPLDPGWARVTVQTAQLTQKKDIFVGSCESDDELRAAVWDEFAHLLQHLRAKDVLLLCAAADGGGGAAAEWLAVGPASDVAQVVARGILKLTEKRLVENPAALPIAFPRGLAAPKAKANGENGAPKKRRGKPQRPALTAAEDGAELGLRAEQAEEEEEEAAGEAAEAEAAEAAEATASAATTAARAAARAEARAAATAAARAAQELQEEVPAVAEVPAAPTEVEEEVQPRRRQPNGYFAAKMELKIDDDEDRRNDDAFDAAPAVKPRAAPVVEAAASEVAEAASAVPHSVVMSVASSEVVTLQATAAGGGTMHFVHASGRSYAVRVPDGVRVGQAFVYQLPAAAPAAPPDDDYGADLTPLDYEPPPPPPPPPPKEEPEVVVEEAAAPLPPDEEAPPPPEEDPHGLVRRRVRVHGLRNNNAELNGKVGMATAFDGATQRYRVRIEGQDGGEMRVLALKATHLEVAADYSVD